MFMVFVFCFDGVEMPAGCGFWRWPRVVRVLQRYGFRFARFDGCMCGLTTSVVGLEAAGRREMAVKKPWKVACLRTGLPEMLN